MSSQIIFTLNIVTTTYSKLNVYSTDMHFRSKPIYTDLFYFRMNKLFPLVTD